MQIWTFNNLKFNLSIFKIFPRHFWRTELQFSRSTQQALQFDYIIILLRPRNRKQSNSRYSNYAVVIFRPHIYLERSLSSFHIVFHTQYIEFLPFSRVNNSGGLFVPRDSKFITLAESRIKPDRTAEKIKNIMKCQILPLLVISLTFSTVLSELDERIGSSINRGIFCKEYQKDKILWFFIALCVLYSWFWR